MDVTEHGEEAYTDGDGAILVSPKDAALGEAPSTVIAVAAGGRL